MTKINTAALERLTVRERVRLAQDLWDSLRPSVDELPLTEEQRALAARRLAEHRADPDSSLSWEELRARIEAD